MMAFVVILIAEGVSTLVKAHSEFGCTYNDNQYSVDTTWTRYWPDDAVYSGPITARLAFKTEREFQAFYENVKKIMSEELTRYPYDNVKPYIKMYKKYEKVAKDYTKFFYNVVAPYPSSENSMTALLRVYRRLLEDTSGVADSFVMGTIDHNIDADMEEKCFAGMEPMEDGMEFQNEAVVGILRFSVGKDAGVILLDMGDFKTPTPIVMEDERHKLNTNYAKFNMYLEYEATFTNWDNFIMINYHNSRGDLERKDLLYTARSLCSFVQSTEKVSLLYPVRDIVAFSAQGPLVAYVTIDKHEILLYTDSPAEDYDGIETKFARGSTFGVQLELKDVYYDGLLPLQEAYIADVGRRLGMAEHALHAELASFSEIAVSHSEFCTHGATWYNSLYKSPKKRWADVFFYAAKPGGISWWQAQAVDDLETLGEVGDSETSGEVEDSGSSGEVEDSETSGKVKDSEPSGKVEDSETSGKIKYSSTSGEVKDSLAEKSNGSLGRRESSTKRTVPISGEDD